MALGDVLFVADGTLHTKDLCLCKSLLLLHGTEVHGEESNKLSLVFTFFFWPGSTTPAENSVWTQSVR